MHRAGLFACVAVAIACGASLFGSRATLRAQGPSPEVRALWVMRANLDTPDLVRRIVSSAAANGFNTLFVQASIAAPDADNAPLAEAIAQAHARGLRVHAWIDVTLAAAIGELPRDRQHVIYEHPEWLMVPRELAAELLAVSPGSPEYLGRLTRWSRAQSTRVQGLYVSPVHRGAAEQMAAALRDLVVRYPIDGVHFDQARYPDAEFDYSRAAVDSFRQDLRRTLTAADRASLDAIEQIDPFAYPNERPEEWRLYRQTQLSGLVTRLYHTVKTARPGATVSIAIDPSPEDAQRDHFQDWRTWVDNRWLDAVSVAGSGDASEFARQIREVRALVPATPVWSLARVLAGS